MDDFGFDSFGFTAVAEKEIDAVKDAEKTGVDKAQKVYNSIQGLLTKLKENPENRYIDWKNRVSDIERFEEYLNKLMKE